MDRSATMNSPATETRLLHRLSFQLAMAFLLVALVPLLLVVWFNGRSAVRAIEHERLENLVAIAERQADELREYMDNMEGIAALLADSPQVIQLLIGAGTESQGGDCPVPSSRSAAVITGRLSQLDMTALFLVNREGRIVFSTQAALPRGENLFSEVHQATPLARVVDRARWFFSTQVSEFTDETPDGQPAFYLAAPVIYQGRLIGVMAVSLDNQAIYQRVNNVTGLGDTGETLIAAAHKNTYTLLNNTRHAPEAAFSQITPITIAHDGSGDCLFEANPDRGAAVGIDYRGVPVLAAWEYLPSLRWSIITKVDLEEVMLPIRAYERSALKWALATTLVILVLSIVLARTITRPIVALTAATETIAEGNLKTQAPVRSRNEIGLLARTINTMARSLRTLVERIMTTCDRLLEHTNNLGVAARQQADVAQRSQTATVEIAATAKQIAATSRELTQTMRDINDVAQQTASQAESGLDGINAIGETMQSLSEANHQVNELLTLIKDKTEAITGITQTMTTVADRTNLLSLNASIEARKAGEYGKGFLVVAREIQRLADQTAVATLDIDHAVGAMRDAVGRGVQGVGRLSREMDSGVREISTVSGRLSSVIQQVQGLPARFEMVLEGMQSQSEGAGQINEAISHLSESARQTVAALEQTRTSVNQLQETANQLQTEIDRFQV